jgi:RND family efflux transporter MFP subunit
MKNLRFQLWFAAIAFAMVGLSSCSREKAAAPAAQPEVVRDVRLVETAVRKLPDTVDAVGTVRAAESATLSAQVMGTISKVAVREGDRVRAGQTLLTIDAAQMTAQVERANAGVAAMEQQVSAAESDAALAASTLKRYEMLQAQKSVSPQEFDEVAARAGSASARAAALRSQQAEAEAARAAARTMQGYTRIHAPFDGMVTERKVDPGAMAAPGTPLLTIEKSGALQLEVAVDESLLSAVRVGSAVPVVMEAFANSPLPGKVARIVPSADPGSRSFLVKIDLPPAKGLYSGMFGHALFARGKTKDVLTVPRSALVTHGSMQSVYVVGPNQIAGVRYISAGDLHGDEIEVLSGLSPGESIVASPGERELAGKRIEVGQ